jgi:hypothetical protein
MRIAKLMLPLVVLAGSVAALDHPKPKSPPPAGKQSESKAPAANGTEDKTPEAQARIDRRLSRMVRRDKEIDKRLSKK